MHLARQNYSKKTVAFAGLVKLILDQRSCNTVGYFQWRAETEPILSQKSTPYFFKEGDKYMFILLLTSVTSYKLNIFCEGYNL